jgi:hypothetical protein
MLIRKSNIILLALISFQMTVTGCIVLPIPTGDIREGIPVKEDQLELLKIGITSKDDVIRYLGEPRFIWEEARLLGYDWEKSSFIILWGGAGGYSATGGLIDITDKYAFLIQFDEQDKVCRFQIVKRPQYDNQYGDLLREWVGGVKNCIIEKDKSK